MELSEKLQELRKQKGLTQEELAAKLYVSRTAVSKWESGRGYPSIESLTSIARFFSVTVDELLSSREALALAQADGKRAQTHMRDLVYGLLDLGSLLLLFLPLFAERAEWGVRALSLLALDFSFLKIVFLVLVCASALTGVLLLALQNCQSRVWIALKSKLSFAFSSLLPIFFTICLQPYAAAFMFSLLVVKAHMLLKFH